MKERNEIVCQGIALSKIHGFEKDAIKIIWKYGALFRRIVEDHKLINKSLSSADIIWIASKELGRDLQTDG